MIVKTLAMAKPRLIGFIAEVSLSVARTVKMPMIEAMTPTERAASGKTRPMAHFSGCVG